MRERDWLLPYSLVFILNKTINFSPMCVNTLYFPELFEQSTTCILFGCDSNPILEQCPYSQEFWVRFRPLNVHNHSGRFMQGGY